MKAYKIDSENKSVIEIEIDPKNSLTEMQAVVGGYIEVAINLDNDDTIFVNEEGLFGGPKTFFTIEGGLQPYAGNGLVIGTNIQSGESTDAQSSLAEIKAKVKYLTIDQVRDLYDTDV
jgi:hypothetical protein